MCACRRTDASQRRIRCERFASIGPEESARDEREGHNCLVAGALVSKCCPLKRSPDKPDEIPPHVAALIASEPRVRRYFGDRDWRVMSGTTNVVITNDEVVLRVSRDTSHKTLRYEALEIAPTLPSIVGYPGIRDWTRPRTVTSGCCSPMCQETHCRKVGPSFDLMISYACWGQLLTSSTPCTPWKVSCGPTVMLRAAPFGRKDRQLPSDAKR